MPAYFDEGGAVYNVKAPAYGIFGDNINNDAEKLQQLLDLIADNGGGVAYFPPNPLDINNEPTPYLLGMTDNGNVIQVPESVTIHIAQGAILRMFDPAAGPTPLYLHGRLECGCYRIFHDLSESPVPLVLADSAPAEVRPEWFGAEADNVYDDALGQDDLSQLTDATSALRASLASLPRVGGVICFLPGQYLVTSEIVIDKNAVLFRGAGRQGNASAGTKQHGSYLAFGGGGVRTGTEGACCGSRG